MIGYHLSYKKEDFSEKLLDAVKALSLKPNEDKIYSFANVIGELYGIGGLNFQIKPQESPLNEGVFIGVSNKIIFYTEPSLITVLHEIRHWVQFNTDLNKLDLSYEDRELDARAWSSSLFYSVFPDEYIELCNRNMIKYK